MVASVVNQSFAAICWIRIDIRNRAVVDCWVPYWPLVQRRNIFSHELRATGSDDPKGLTHDFGWGRRLRLSSLDNIAEDYKPMRRAGHKRPASVRAIPATQSVTARKVASLEVAIQQRIETRLLGRIRNLRVRVVDGVVILEGECATYYTKQLAQHTAMGILEDEQLENAIVVSVR